MEGDVYVLDIVHWERDVVAVGPTRYVEIAEEDASVDKSYLSFDGVLPLGDDAQVPNANELGAMLRYRAMPSASTSYCRRSSP